jgi:hypothetical protein
VKPRLPAHLVIVAALLLLKEGRMAGGMTLSTTPVAQGLHSPATPDDAADGAIGGITSMTLIEALERLMELWQLPWTEERYGEAQVHLSRIRESVQLEKLRAVK